ncbi:MAG: redox-sensing transcriptional repressor Rex [Chloroflexia bacterium]|nr:redox-sensing transcriptional repressor Rex [Chloroflexia bacterium]
MATVGESNPSHRQPAAETGTSAAPLADRNGNRVSSRPSNLVTGGIPDIVIRRLPVYVRTLSLLADRGVESVSSDELARHIGVTAAQIRRDLSYFGKFGKQGKGYSTELLAGTISRILQLDRQWDVALAGFGNLGRAIAHYRGFLPAFRVAAIFDSSSERSGERFNELTVQPVERITEIVAAEKIRIGIIAVRTGAAQDVADRMIAGGARALLNYTTVVLRVPANVTVREIDPVGAMQSMTYYLDERDD